MVRVLDQTPIRSGVAGVCCEATGTGDSRGRVEDNAAGVGVRKKPGISLLTKAL